MQVDDLVQLQDELRRIRVRIRRTQCLAAVACLALGLAFLTGQGNVTSQPASPDTLEARAILLKDSKGNVRAFFGVMPDDSEVGLGLKNPKEENPEVTLRLTERNAEFALRAGSEIATLVAQKEGQDPAGVHFAMATMKNGQPPRRLLAFGAVDPGAFMTFWDKNGKRGVTMGTADDGQSPHFGILDARDDTRFVWRVPDGPH